MKYNDEAVEKLIKYVVALEALCPNQLGLKIIENCKDGTSCTDCWKQALAGEEE